MARFARRPLLLAAVFAAVAAVSVGAGALTGAFYKPPVPPVIATVDLQTVVSGLEKRKQKEQEFQSKGKEFKDNLDALKKQIDDEQKTYDTSPAGPAKTQMGQQLVRKALQYKFDSEYAEQFLDQMYGEMLREMYDDIALACKKLAVRNGYTIVMTDDSGAQIPRGGRVDVTRAISMKRMLYVDPAHDVTRELIDMMNNDFAAGLTKGP